MTTAAARAMSERDAAECPLVTQSLPLVAACLTAHYKELPAMALSCLDALLGQRSACPFSDFSGQTYPPERL